MSTAGVSPVMQTPSTAECNDGIDNDGDGLEDYPYDPKCDSLSDTSETPGVFFVMPACSNHADDDGDFFVDFKGDNNFFLIN